MDLRPLVAAAAVNQTPLDWNGNTERLKRVIREANDQGVSLLLLPELAISGYGCEDAFLRPGTCKHAFQCLADLCLESKGMTVGVGLPIRHNRKLYNGLALIVDGTLTGIACKKYLAGDGVHYEPRWFKPWPVNTQSFLQEPSGIAVDKDIPIGDIYFQVNGIVIGTEVCEEAWVYDRPGRSLAAKGVDIVLNPSASHFAFGKRSIRRGFVEDGSRAFMAAYLYANLLGNESGRIIFDGQTLIAENGTILAEGPRFSFHDHAIAYARLDLEATRQAAVKTTSYQTQPEAVTSRIVARVSPRPFTAAVPTLPPLAWESQKEIRFEEFLRAGALGLYDYMRKAHSGGFVVSLSGGADSAAVALLVSETARLATQELGIEEASARLLGKPKGFKDSRELLSSILSCVYQASKQSSDTTEKAAATLALDLGSPFFVFDIAPIVDSYLALVRQAIGRELSWEEFDIPLQNIQARTRAPSAWALANFTGKTLLNTSNRSEAAVGYCTMDGDTSGGLNPIGGIDKAFLREWLRWMCFTGPTGGSSVRGLKLVVDQQPTAELRPKAMAQTDESDLMPYPILNMIESLAIRDGFDPIDVFTRLREQFGERYTVPDYEKWIVKFFQLFARNQWKRERLALAFHFDDHNLDPKTWCRFPVLNSSFELELEELREYVSAL